MAFNEPIPLVTALNVTAAKAAFTALGQVFANHSVLLSEGEKMSYQREGQKTEPFVDRSIIFAHNHGGKIPADLVVQTLDDNVASKAAMEDILAFGMPIVNKVQDILTVLGIILVRDSNRIYAHAKIEAKHDSSIKEEVDGIGERYQKSPPAAPGIYDVAKDGNLSLSGIIPGYRVVNTGSSIINARCGSELATKVQDTSTIRIMPGDSEIIPAGWTSIIITNESTTVPAKFMIKK